MICPACENGTHLSYRYTGWSFKFDDGNFFPGRKSTPFFRARPWNFAHVFYEPLTKIDGFFFTFWFFVLWDFMGGQKGPTLDQTISAKERKNTIPSNFSTGMQNTCAKLQGLDWWQWKRDVPKVIFPNYSKKKPAEDTLVPPLWVTREKKVVFLGLFVHAAVRGGTCAFALKIVNTLIKNSSRNDRPSIST